MSQSQTGMKVSPIRPTNAVSSCGCDGCREGRENVREEISYKDATET